MCPMHSHRVYRRGSVSPEREPKWQDLTGERYGTLTLVRRTGSRWACVCDCGETRTASTGELNRTGEANTCGKPGKHLSADAEYTAAHERVRRLHGAARNHPCVDCGKSAYHWSYDHSDPDELISRTVHVAYSLDTNHYQARCVPCHKRFDLNHINATTRFSKE